MSDDIEKKSATLRDKGNDEYRQGRYTDAVGSYTESLKLCGSRITYGNRAQANLKINTIESLEACVEDSKAALGIDKEFTKGYFRAGCALLKLGKVADAKGYYETALAVLGENDTEPLVAQAKQVLDSIKTIEKNLAQHEKGGHPPDQTYRLLKPVSEHITHDLPILLAFVTACAETSRHDEVIAQLKPVLDHNPFKGCKELVWLYGSAFYELALVDEAERIFESLHRMDALYKSLDKKRKTLASFKVVIDTATTYSKGNKFDWAHITLTKAIDDEKTYTENMRHMLQTHRAIVSMHLSKYSDAIEDCTAALSSNTKGPWRARAYQCRGYCHEATDEMMRAVKDYEAAFELNPDPQTRSRIDTLRKMKPRRKDYYGILGVSKTATETDIKKAYRQLALAYHPDKIALASEDEKERMKDLFQDIQEAYSILSDPSKRERFDSGETRDSIDGPDNDPLVFFNLACGSLPDDATAMQKCMYDTKKVAFWSCTCIVATISCPCWCPYYCLQDRTQYKSQFEKYQQEYQEKHASTAA
eukprot:TRINITY_DN3253_c0_g2_i1.p3 TRINITY_DN3253_c0_g2~~TRINITY_DN3253_c0_g2_i1.p3  ORF type:complete len:532 (+),score=151.46 TRINITY_DN3253_c0_g2_i1:2243-3838(+)